VVVGVVVVGIVVGGVGEVVGVVVGGVGVVVGGVGEVVGVVVGGGVEAVVDVVEVEPRPPDVVVVVVGYESSNSPGKPVSSSPGKPPGPSPPEEVDTRPLPLSPEPRRSFEYPLDPCLEFNSDPAPVRDATVPFADPCVEAPEGG
jgi:hypothetical protein